MLGDSEILADSEILGASEMRRFERSIFWAGSETVEPWNYYLPWCNQGIMISPTATSGTH